MYFGIKNTKEFYYLFKNITLKKHDNNYKYAQLITVTRKKRNLKIKYKNILGFSPEQLMEFKKFRFFSTTN